MMGTSARLVNIAKEGKSQGKPFFIINNNIKELLTVDRCAERI